MRAVAEEPVREREGERKEINMWKSFSYLSLPTFPPSNQGVLNDILKFSKVCKISPQIREWQRWTLKIQCNQSMMHLVWLQSVLILITGMLRNETKNVSLEIECVIRDTNMSLKIECVIRETKKGLIRIDCIIRDTNMSLEIIYVIWRTHLSL